MANNELYHFGIPGMKWGKRKARYYIQRIKNDHAQTKAAKEESKKIAEEAKEQVHLIKRQRHDQKIIDKATFKAQSKILKKQASEKENTDQNKKSVSEMSNDELRKKIERVQLENQLRNITPAEKERHAFIKSIANDTLVPALKTSGKKFISDFIDSQSKKILGESSQDKFDKLKREVDEARLKNDLKNFKKQDPNENLKSKVETARLNKEYEGYTKKDPYKEMQDVIKKSNTVKAYEKAFKEEQERQAEKAKKMRESMAGRPMDYNYKPNTAVKEIAQKYSTLYLEDKRR